MKQKFLALLLVLALALSVAPMAAFAAESCPHTNTFTTTDPETGEAQTTCYTCGENITAPGTMPVSGDHIHEVGSGCVCTICGETVHGFKWETNEVQHRSVCSVCGIELSGYEKHTISDTTGRCTICDYGCNHENAKFYYTQNGHEKYCSDCHKMIVPWTMHQGTCDICGFTPCADGTHVFGTDPLKKHVCTICNTITSHEDKNGDCVCDICDDAFHIYDVEELYRNETHHWWVCDVCHKEIAYEHYDFDKNGECDYCVQAVNNPDSGSGSGSGSGSVDPTNPADPEKPTDPTDPADPEKPTEPEKPSNSKGLDNVPKTGDVAAAALTTLLGIGAAIVPFRKRFN